MVCLWRIQALRLIFTFTGAPQPYQVSRVLSCGMHAFTPLEQWAVRFYVHAFTIRILQDQELLRSRAEVSRLRALVAELRAERDSCLAVMDEVD